MYVSLSIAIVTRNRPESLERTLTSLRSQDIEPFEVLVSDDSDQQEAVEANRILASRYGADYLAGPRRGLYANRNFVALHCRGTHIRTMDDDHEFPQGHLSVCMAAIRQQPEVIWTIGEYHYSFLHRPLPPPVPGQLHPRGFSIAPASLDRYYGLSCGATIYPRSVVDRNILNLETYKFGVLYLEYGARLRSLGYTIKPLRDTYVIHYYQKSSRSYTSSQISNRARLFSILMFSFCHQPGWYNKLLTTTTLVHLLVTRQLSVRDVLGVVRRFTEEKRKLLTDANRDNLAGVSGSGGVPQV